MTRRTQCARTQRRLRCAAAVGMLIGLCRPGVANETPGASPASLPSPPALSPEWRIEARTLSQPAGPGSRVWQIDYTFRRSVEASAIVVSPDQVELALDGWVSNAGAAGHGTPRRAEHHQTKLRARGAGALAGTSRVALLDSRDEVRRCAEVGTLELWPAGCGEDVENETLQRLGTLGSLGMAGVVPVVVPGGGGLRARIRLSHDHFLHGTNSLLLGERTVALRLTEGESIGDRIALNRPLRSVEPVPEWTGGEPPRDRSDRGVYLTAPDSLRLCSGTPGQSYYRMTGPVRPGARVRLEFWYLQPDDGADVGGNPACGGGVVRIAQLQQGPNVWKPLPNRQQEVALETRGRWCRYRQVLLVDAEATTLSLEFRAGEEPGLIWVDNLSVVSLDAPDAGP